MWTEKYRPRTLDEVLGNPQLVKSIKEYDWKKAVLLYGPAGCGKSSLLWALAADMDFDLVEITEENLKEAKAATQTKSLFGKQRLIYIDNVDQIRSIKEVTLLVKETKNPLILITSDYSSKKLATLKRTCEKAQMRRLTAKTIEKRLAEICSKEGVEAEPDVLRMVSENATGDMRSAIIDLETLAKGRGNITKKDLEFLEKRDRTADIYKALSQILTKKELPESIRSLYDLTEQPKDILLWIDENIPQVYTDPGDIQRAYEYIAKADMFLGRIIRRQYWGFLRYASPLMSGGVCIAKKNKIRYGMYKFPSYLIKMSQTKKDRRIKKSIGEKLTPILHASRKVIDREYIPLFRTLMENNVVGKEALAEEYMFDEEELEYLSS